MTEHKELSDLEVKVFSIAGNEICTVKVPRDITLKGLKDKVSRAARCTVTGPDSFCFGAETWENGSSKPLQSLQVHTVEVTWVKTEGMHVGDEYFYTGPGLNGIERGDVGQISPGDDGSISSHLCYRRVFFPRANVTLMVHQSQLSRCLPSPKALPLGCRVGDIFFYTGPPRRGCNGSMLKPGTRGEVVEAGLIDDSVRMRFDDFRCLCSVEFRSLAKEPPQRRWTLLKLLKRFVSRLCWRFNRWNWKNALDFWKFSFDPKQPKPLDMVDHNRKKTEQSKASTIDSSKI